MRFGALCALAVLLVSAQRADALIWPSRIDRTAEILAHGRPEAKRIAVARLGDVRTEAGERLVRLALADQDPMTRLVAARIAERWRLDVSEMVIAWLDGSEPMLHGAAVRLLTVNPMAAIPGLGRALSDSDPELRRLAARALGRQPASEAASVLLGNLDDPEPSVRVAVVEALSRLEDPRAGLALAARYGDSDARVRHALVGALDRLGDAGQVGVLGLALRDRDPGVRARAALAVGRWGDESSVVELASLLTAGEPPAVVEGAAVALARRGNAAAVRVLFQGLQRVDAPKAVVAVMGQLRVGDSSPRDELLECLRDPRSSHVERCLPVVGAIAVPLSALTRCLSDPGIFPPLVLDAIGRTPSEGAVPIVLTYLSHPDPNLREAAYRSLASLLEQGTQGGLAVDPLLERLVSLSPDDPDRVPILRLLGLTGSPRAIGVLSVEAAVRPPTMAALAAVESLGRLGQGGLLLRALDSADGRMRAAAALALFRIQDPLTAGPLLERLERRGSQRHNDVLFALSGALVEVQNPSVLQRAVAWLRRAPGPHREALLVGMARNANKEALEALGDWPVWMSGLDRAKLAEALGGGDRSEALLLLLARDARVEVRANTAWSLGRLGDKSSIVVLRRLAGDPSIAVAANALIALGRVAARTGYSARSELCQRLTDRAVVLRGAALMGLRVAGYRCPDGRERQLLVDDPSAPVRQAAAWLIAGDRQEKADQVVLDACRAEETNPLVAKACAPWTPRLKQKVEPVSIQVTGYGATLPQPRLDYALLRADGTVRLGWADRQGSIFEPEAPAGNLSLTSWDPATSLE